MGDPPVQNGALAGQVDQLRMPAGVEHSLTPLGHFPECGHKVHFLEGARAQHLSVDLACQGQHR